MEDGGFSDDFPPLLTIPAESAWLGACLSLGMTPDELKHRTKTFAIEVIKTAKSLPSDYVTAHIARQLVRSGTSVGANYRSSCRAKSEADFIAKMSIVEEEADETGYWLELLVETNAITPKAVAAISSEADQLVRIAVASIKTTRGRSR
jgi:four helix bundle protein